MVVLVVLQVSEPYNRTDFTLELNRRIFVRVEIWWDFQIFLRVVKADLAFPILDFTSTSVPPCWLMTLPRYVKVSTSSRLFPSSVTGAGLDVLIFKMLVFCGWMSRPT